MKKNSNYIQAGEFKAKCLKIMENVCHYHSSYIVTKRGKPIVKITPLEDTSTDYFGCMKNTVSIEGDLLDPIDVTWEAEE